MAIQENERKLAELVLYISQKYANDPNFGQVKLNKALFFPDFTAYGSWGQTITGAQYQHNPEGPTVLRMLPLLAALTADGSLEVQRVSTYGYTQKRTVNLRNPNLSLFSGKEIALVDTWVERLRPMNGKQVSDYSHETAAWRLTATGEIIDPKTVYIAWSTPTSADIKRGQAIAEMYGLLA